MSGSFSAKRLEIRLGNDGNPIIPAFEKIIDAYIMAIRCYKPGETVSLKRFSGNLNNFFDIRGFEKCFSDFDDLGREAPSFLHDAILRILQHTGFILNDCYPIVPLNTDWFFAVKPEFKLEMLVNHDSFSIYVIKEFCAQDYYLSNLFANDEMKNTLSDRCSSFVGFREISRILYGKQETFLTKLNEIILEKMSFFDKHSHQNDVILTSANSIKEKLKSYVVELSPNKFEKLCLSLIKKMAGDSLLLAEHQGKTGDNGIDGVIFTSDPIYGENRCGIQCKRYSSGTVSIAEVRSFAGALEYAGLMHGFFITTARFASGCISYVDTLSLRRIKLIDGESLCNLMIDYQVGIKLSSTQKQFYSLDEEFFQLILE